MGSTERPLYIFGYGSLIWRPSLPFVRQHVGVVAGWERRFWQASPDHRGTPEFPGRVATLRPVVAAACWGRVFEVEPDHAVEVLQALELREQAGYARETVTVECPDEGAIEGVLAYIAHPGNPHDAGPASEPAIAERIRRAHGPSGSNVEYLLRLAEALSELGRTDPHVAGLARLVSETSS